MSRKNHKLTSAQRKAKRERNKKYMIIFVGGKQKRVRRPPTIEGLPVDEYIARNADPIFLHQMGMWEAMPCEPESESPPETSSDEIPF